MLTFWRICRGLLSAELSESPIAECLSRRPAHFSPAHQVQMQVEDTLPCVRTYVKDRSVAVLKIALAGDFGGHDMTVADQLGVSFRGLLDIDDVLLGNDEYVNRCLWANILEDKCALVLINLVCRNAASDDLAEKAVGHKEILAIRRGRLA